MTGLSAIHGKHGGFGPPVCKKVDCKKYLEAPKKYPNSC